MAQLNFYLSGVEDPRTLLLQQYKAGKRHETPQVCLAGANLPVRGRKVGKKKKEELKGTNSSLTQNVGLVSYETGQFCSCSSLWGCIQPCFTYQKGERVALCKQVSASAISSHYYVGENKQHKTKHAVPLGHLCKTYRHQSRCEWTLDKRNG